MREEMSHHKCLQNFFHTRWGESSLLFVYAFFQQRIAGAEKNVLHNDNRLLSTVWVGTRSYILELDKKSDLLKVIFYITRAKWAKQLKKIETFFSMFLTNFLGGAFWNEWLYIFCKSLVFKMHLWKIAILTFSPYPAVILKNSWNTSTNNRCECIRAQ